jgi:predicted DNA-binding transcriptional regulator YafY
MRASRLLSILILLQLRGRLTAEDLAAEFEVSERTVYRDIDALSAAGVPVYGDRGPGGGFALLEGYQTRLTGLAADEAEAMPMIGMIGPATDLGLGHAASAAKRKLFAALPQARQKTADRVVERVHFDAVDWYRAADPQPHLPAIARAVLDQLRVSMRYASWRGVRHWEVEPLGLVMKAGVWYLVAHGHGKARIFRLSNMSDVLVLAEAFVRPDRFDLASWWQAEQTRFEAELFSQSAILRVSPLGRKRLAALSPRGAAAVHGLSGNGWETVRMAIENSDHGARELIGLGAEFEVVSPPDLRQRIAAMASAIADHHGGGKDGEIGE